MANDEEKKKGGCLGKLVGLVTLIVIVGTGVSGYFISKPQDLTEVAGYSKESEQGVSPPRDLLTVLRKSIEGGYSVTISEKEINEMLAAKLEIEQGGLLQEWVSIKGVAIRLEDEIAEVIVEREIEGFTFTTSMFLQVEQNEDSKGITTEVHFHGDGYHEMLPSPKRGGRYGQLTVPQGFLLLVMPDFRKIAEAFDDEIELGFRRMARVKIAEGRLTLDPRMPESEVGGGENSF
ncbi:MAG: hypothetical protein AB8D78_00170 [Akkermansiaceae bacterium]